MNNSFKVCVRCMTFNQASYIEDAMRGFYMQETSFPVVFVVVDDASTDGEQDVLKAWVSEYLDVEEGCLWHVEPYGKVTKGNLKWKNNHFFVILLLAENHYQAGKGYKKYEYIKEWIDSAKYSALCEGDDYWTDITKLQRQVDYLEQHIECLAVAENGIELNINTDRKSIFNKSTERIIDYTLEELLLQRRFPTASVMYRNILYKSEKYLNMRYRHDTAVWCCMASIGKVRFVNVKSSVYRRGSGITITTNRLKWAQKTEKWYLYLLDYFKDNISDETVFEVKKMIYVHYLVAAVDGIRRHDKKERNAAIEKMNELDLSSHVIYDVLLQYLKELKNYIILWIKKSFNNSKIL